MIGQKGEAGSHSPYGSSFSASLQKMRLTALSMYFLRFLVRELMSLQDGWTPLIMASLTGHAECVQLFLDRGAQVNHQDEVSTVLDQAILVIG